MTCMGERGAAIISQPACNVLQPGTAKRHLLQPTLARLQPSVAGPSVTKQRLSLKPTLERDTGWGGHLTLI